ncbi:hypothetical protein Tco_1310185 [Tanacetum coccineum]
MFKVIESNFKTARATRLTAKYVCRSYDFAFDIGDFIGSNVKATSVSSGKRYANTRRSTAGAPTEKKKINYVVVTDVVAFLGGLGCYLNIVLYKFKTANGTWLLFVLENGFENEFLLEGREWSCQAMARD